MTIRESISDDLPVLIDFQIKMAKETEGVMLSHEHLHPGISNVFADNSRGKYYVALIGEEIVGCLMTTFEWSEWRNGNVLWIQSVYVSVAHRGQGVYKNLYRHIQNLVNNDTTLKGIRLYADKQNTAAHEVYTKMGMNGEHYQVFEWMKP